MLNVSATMLEEISIDALESVTGGRKAPVPVAAVASPSRNAKLLPLITQLTTKLQALRSAQDNDMMKWFQAFIQLRKAHKA